MAAMAVAAAALLGCNDLENCGSTPVEITRTDGGLYRCVTSEDCPRTSRVSVCVTDVSSERECVRCDETRCVRLIPESCQ
ncbi:hypothetical protein D7X55_10625 [Corallococcus sp. AB049A]|uniref:Uncharacterized protein n=2 Tax=Myxococcaceae TaxID=31 RepID=A0A3A8QN95_9BACT|nr:hypothetical protein D7Y23_23940 [Corallococcus sp. AB050B]RKH68350.1 hypothetical protein D7X96_17670 [Corallococcus interemptor]RKI69955.1 hypothetical protein D7X55_10625 [Corallococcus sp. AB049A]